MAVKLLSKTCSDKLGVIQAGTMHKRYTRIMSAHQALRRIYINHHPEVDRIWVYKEYIRVLLNIIFYLLQDGCMCIYKSDLDMERIPFVSVYEAGHTPCETTCGKSSHLWRV